MNKYLLLVLVMGASQPVYAGISFTTSVQPKPATASLNQAAEGKLDLVYDNNVRPFHGDVLAVHAASVAKSTAVATPAVTPALEASVPPPPGPTGMPMAKHDYEKDARDWGVAGAVVTGAAVGLGTMTLMGALFGGLIGGLVAYLVTSAYYSANHDG